MPKRRADSSALVLKTPGAGLGLRAVLVTIFSANFTACILASAARRSGMEPALTLALSQRERKNYLIPGMNPFIPRIIFARPPFCIRFIISRICSN